MKLCTQKGGVFLNAYKWIQEEGGGGGGRGGGGIENWTFSGYVLNGGHLCEYVNQQRTKVRTRPC